jgi:rhodanese-related sulfurtransferase
MKGEKRRLVVEGVGIMLLCSVLGVLYNAVSERGIPPIRKSPSITWESDTGTLGNNSAGSGSGVDKDSSIEYHEQKPVDRELEQPRSMVRKERVEKESSDLNEPQGVPAITLSQAYDLFQRHKAVFLDARHESEYRLGHIKGAISLPFNEFEKHAVQLGGLPVDTTLVTYCDGGECDLSMKLAFELSQKGFRRVKVYYGGWAEWVSSNHPIEKDDDNRE